jgi:hypothetical protein
MPFKEYDRNAPKLKSQTMFWLNVDNGATLA